MVEAVDIHLYLLFLIISRYLAILNITQYDATRDGKNRSDGARAEEGIRKKCR